MDGAVVAGAAVEDAARAGRDREATPHSPNGVGSGLPFAAVPAVAHTVKDYREGQATAE